MNIPRHQYRISIISSCNMKCEYCHNEGNIKYDKLSKNDIEKLIIDSQGLGLEAIRLTGGEPLIHPEINEICEMLYEKYNLKIGINTNCVEIEKLIYLIKKGWIDRVIVGLDYFDSPISKSSPIGVSSKQILTNILTIKNLGCNVSISSVYNNDLENKMKTVDWCIKNNIRIKILEIVTHQKEKSTSQDFLNLQNILKNKFNLIYSKDEYNEINGYKDDKKVITFFHSHCKIRECDICKEIHLRITANGKMKQCMYTTKDDINIKNSNFRENLINYLKTPAKFYK